MGSSSRSDDKEDSLVLTVDGAVYISTMTTFQRIWPLQKSLMMINLEIMKQRFIEC